MSAVFLDRDGVICEHRPDYVKSWEEFQFLPESLEALKKLSSLNAFVIVLSNQSCIGRGLTTEHKVRKIHSMMLDRIRQSGGRVDDVFFCPHSPEEVCSCRKPRTGMLENAAHKYNVDLKNSWVVGDNLTDIEMGQTAGCKTILVSTGLGKTFVRQVKNQGTGTHIVDNLMGAVDLILKSTPSKNNGDQGNG